ncbi:DAK2 domain-containing protein [Demequina capsici]|uniref:DAK2 domain-containing protein n=1 Tax=Demequina capsici TaxID=3075620 RepID=A0AA96FDQ9_9MICO|nr:DAK2 domain-containing protein [Demequina sp. PMTSA13]WNM28263.1 DAK2 domain-containing protein [Demequina sp. PMTSA13]
MSEATDLRRWLEAGVDAVKRARESLDAINVFPVADADTGTNIYLTLQEGNRAVAKLPDDATHREVVAAFARGALVGARGNSGVIVSQYLSGFLTAIDERGGLNRARPAAIAEALEIAAEAAYRAVSSPVEGTILTVARAAAKGARGAVGAKAGREAVAVAAVVSARAALAATHEQLPSARRAGVVDAGAAGLVLQLEMLAETLAGRDALAALDEVEWELRDGHSVISTPSPHGHGLPGGGAYEVMFVASPPDMDDVDRLRLDLEGVGDSVTVSFGHGLAQAHVHTDAPELAVRIAQSVDARQIVVRSLLMSHVADRAATGVVALTSCPGLAEPLTDAGAVVLVVPDPARMKKRELRRAVKDASGSSSVVVAGNLALRLAARELAARRRHWRMTVLEAGHEAQVIAAVAAAALATPGEDLAALMADAVARTATGASSVDALDDDVERLLGPYADVVTLILARGVPADVAEAVRRLVARTAPMADVQVYEGGHGEPGILIGVESSPVA